MYNMIKIVDFYPFMHGQAASFPLNSRQITAFNKNIISIDHHVYTEVHA